MGKEFDRCTRAAFVALALCAMVLVGANASGGGAQDHSAVLVGDKGVLSGSLKNGVGYVVVPRKGGAARGIAVRIRIGAGTLDEREDQIGAAHMVGRLVFTKSEQFKQGEARQRFGEMGMAFDRFRNVSTLHSETVYSFGVSDARHGALDLVLRVGADAVGGLVFDEETVEMQRRLSIEDARLFRGAARDARTELFERLVPGSGLGERATLIDPQAVERLTAQDLRDYHSTQFTPERTTVIVVGEVDAQRTVRAIDSAFGGLESRTSTDERAGWRVRDRMNERVVVSAIAGEPETTVELLVASEPPRGVRTLRGYEQAVVRDLAIEAMRTRLRRGVLEGSIVAREVAANAWNFAGAARITGVSAVTSGEGWSDCVMALNREVERVRADGFSETDAAGARARVVAQARRGARSARSWSNGWMASRVLDRVRLGSTVLSPQREYELTGQIAGLTDDEDISDAFREMFPEDAWCTVVLGPPGTTPSEEKVAAAARAGRDAPVVTPADWEPLPMLGASDASKGTMTSVEYDPATGVTSAVFANGVIVHHKKVESAVNRMAIGVALAGGRSQESAQTRGFTSAAASVWNAPVWCGTSVAAVDTVLAGRDIQFDGTALDDSMQVTAACDPGEIDAALGVIASTVREPLIEAGALQRWKDSVAAEEARRWSAPGRMVGEVFARATRPEGDPRYGALSAADADRVTLGGVQRWAEEFMDSAPIEASIVGDIERRDALEAAARTLGALPTRARVDVAGDRVRDPGEIIEGAIEVHTTCDPSAEYGIVLIGYRGVSYLDRDRVHALGVVRHAWQDRLAELLQEEEQIASWVGTGVSPGITNPGAGMIWGAAMASPEELDRVGKILIESVHELRTGGVDAAMLEGAVQQKLGEVRPTMDDPMHLALVSCDMVYREFPLIAELRAEASAQSCDAWRVKQLLDEVVAPEQRVVITIRPGTGGSR